MALIGARRSLLKTQLSPQATAFLARTSGLSLTERNAYIALIKGLVADGVWPLLDALYIFATNTTTTANLNLVSTSFTLAKTGTLTFAADVGYTGDGSTGFLDTGLTPSAGGINFTQNSASVGVYVQSNRTAGANTTVNIGGIGTTPSNNYILLRAFDNGNIDFELTGAAFPVQAATSSKAAWALSRTSSTTVNVYQNGSSSAFSSQADTSVGVINNSVFVFAFNNGGGSPAGWSADQMSAAFIGGGLTGAQAAALNNRINTYMATFGINVY